ncbi:ATP-binding protein [Aequorivita marina]|uniref:ATP-binding protein n=1 Tax=Aequorivita marina TaxID=3073654 RepID=UPI002874813B|nr:AAA family ATPase [Aequorivita sp. S2608]MDS1298848.1 AAA family ATPase [Aequorivita sp. S2608]
MENNISQLFIISERILNALDTQKERYLLERIDWSERLIGVKGARGSGKTTLLLQQIKFHLSKTDKALYTSLDNLYFLNNTLIGLAEELVLQGGTHLFLDEVHKYPNWSRELKLIYDQLPSLKVVFTSSSILEINKGESDLSRRAVKYILKEMSFREYLNLKHNLNLSSFGFEYILKNQKKVATELKKQVEFPVAEFKEYLKYGCYPYSFEGVVNYYPKLLDTIDLMLEVDVSAVENMSFQESRKIKKLLVAIAQNAPFTPNVSKLSERLGFSRNFLLNSLKILDRAELIHEFFTPTKGVGAFTKPEKLYLNNTNLIYALAQSQLEQGTLRETFFANQIKHLHEIHLVKKGDFLIDRKYTVEIGGKNKTTQQITGIKNAFVLRDDIEIGALNIVPLHLFGLLY